MVREKEREEALKIQNGFFEWLFLFNFYFVIGDTSSSSIDLDTPNPIQEVTIQHFREAVFLFFFFFFFFLNVIYLPTSSP
jgi:hypothetical protein